VIEVTAAVICRGDRILICQRPAEKSQGLLWEFPGGKIEPGESGEDCIRREIREELGTDIRVTAELPSVTQVYPDKTVHLRFFKAELTGGEPERREHAALEWVLPGELGGYEFCPADRQFLSITENLTRG